MPTALVIGGTGYIGSHLAQALAQAGWQARTASRNAPTVSDPPAAAHPLTWSHADITQDETLEGLFEGCDVAFHLASVSAGTAATLEEVNIEGTRNVAAAAEAAGTRLVYVSTTAVFGDMGGALADESTPARPNTVYGATRLQAEHMTRDVGPSVRLGTVYGPGAPLVREFVLKGGNVQVIGSGRNWANVLHIDDAVRFLIAAGTKGEVGSVYIATDGSPVRPADFYGEMTRLLGHGRPKFVGTARLKLVAPFFAMLERVTRVPSLIPTDLIRLLTNSVQASNAKIVAELGCEPAYASHKAGLSATFREIGL